MRNLKIRCTFTGFPEWCDDANEEYVTIDCFPCRLHIGDILSYSTFRGTFERYERLDDYWFSGLEVIESSFDGDGYIEVIQDVTFKFIDKII